MMKEVLRALDTGSLSTIGLLAFLVAFILILIRIWLYTKQELNHIQNLPLQEDDTVQKV